MAEHDWNMPHDMRHEPDDVEGCPPNCPYRLDVEGAGQGHRPGHGKPLANAADASWAELEALRAEAKGLGLEGYERDPLVVLRDRVEQARAEAGRT